MAALAPAGVVVAGWFFAQSLAPSLLLRTWWQQGLISGVAIALGYGFGLWLAALGRWLQRRVPPPGERRRQALRLARPLALTAIGVYVVWAVLRAVPQHEWTWRRLGHEPASFWYTYLATLAVAAVTALVLSGIGWLMARAWSRVARTGARALPIWLANGLALLLVAWIVLASVNSLVLQRTLAGMNETMTGRDTSLRQAPEPPDSAVRSGGPDSEVDWAAAGHEGRRFLTRGPTVEDLDAFSDGTPTEPVRVFVGRAQTDDVAERATSRSGSWSAPAASTERPSWSSCRRGPAG